MRFTVTPLLCVLLPLAVQHASAQGAKTNSQGVVTLEKNEPSRADKAQKIAEASKKKTDANHTSPKSDEASRQQKLENLAAQSDEASRQQKARQIAEASKKKQDSDSRKDKLAGVAAASKEPKATLVPLEDKKADDHPKATLYPLEDNNSAAAAKKREAAARSRKAAMSQQKK